MIVYHYCSLESLNSILNHRSLRLTNILKSNDSMEISWICRYYDGEFENAYKNASDLLKEKISLEESLKKKIEFICEFAKVQPTIIDGSIRKIDKTNLTYIEPHRIIINDITFLAFNYSNEIFIENLSNKIKLSELENYIK